MAGQYQQVNGVKTLNLHGKNYVEVAERVHMVHEKKAIFSIIKSEPVNVADRWLWVAVIVVDGQQYIGNAEIKMNAPKNTPDGTNPFECGETSAIGRALAFAGFGSVESIASKDEVERSKPYEEQRPVERKEAKATPEKPRVPLAKLKSAAEYYYPGTWSKLCKDIATKYNFLQTEQDVVDVLIFEQYNDVAQALLKPHMQEKKKAS